MRCDEVVGGALPCFSQIQGSSLVSVCVWFMRKIEGPKEVGRSSRAAGEGKRSVGEGRCRRRAVRSVGSFDCWMTYRVDTLHQAVVKPRRSAWW